MSIDLSRYVNAADISAADMPHVVVEKLQRAINESAAIASETAISHWEPIDTAPKDGTNIIVCIAGMPRSTGEAYWWQSAGGVGGWQTWDGENRRRTVYETPPTHWQPLPEVPASREMGSKNAAPQGDSERRAMAAPSPERPCDAGGMRTEPIASSSVGSPAVAAPINAGVPSVGTRDEIIEELAKIIDRKGKSLTEEYCHGDAGPDGYTWTNKEAEWQVILLGELVEEFRALKIAAPQAETGSISVGVSPKPADAAHDYAAPQGSASAEDHAANVVGHDPAVAAPQEETECNVLEQVSAMLVKEDADLDVCPPGNHGGKGVDANRWLVTIMPSDHHGDYRNIREFFGDSLIETIRQAIRNTR